MKANSSNRGKLFLCATPIGNLEDITIRVLETLKNADLVAAENISHTRKLFARYHISTRMISYREANREDSGRRIIHEIESGRDVALVSDAGTPGISDPGRHLVSECLSHGLNVVPLPGANAAVTALIVSGLPTRRFVFEGFLPRKSGQRRKVLMELSKEQRTLIFYESPNRIAATLSDMADILGNRKAALARELTKKFEEIHRGTVTELKQHVEQKTVKGEIVLVVEGLKEKPRASQEQALEAVKRLLDGGLSFKTAVDSVFESNPGISRNKLYNDSLRLYNHT
ncbi:MAG: 16S rRNA (cytidine(1402)-2'-O)-methyltransferase [Actinobacteria bacterium]|nr:16S rRNA (cytidine(1402)-2'-O)-methyltransferase [Actinomycetota bacterium]